jgi:hypothetical protein
MSHAPVLLLSPHNHFYSVLNLIFTQQVPRLSQNQAQVGHADPDIVDLLPFMRLLYTAVDARHLKGLLLWYDFQFRSVPA